MSSKGWLVTVLLPVIFGAAPLKAQAPSKKVCVEVKLHEVEEEKPAPEAAPPSSGAEQKKAEGAPAAADQEEFEARQARINWRLRRLQAARQAEAKSSFLPIGQSPLVFLKRLFEHFVTHEKGYEAVDKDCQETILIELYPLAEGWTVFTRYSGNGREERVDQLFPEEISQFAERAVTALLADSPISDTIKRDTVLRADSMKSAQRIQGTHHFLLNLGTKIRGGQFNTAGGDPAAAVGESIRVFTPMTIGIGYKGRFENWGLESTAQAAIGTSRTAARSNQAGGHIDFGGDVGLALHFLHYLQPRGIHSFYWGAGANFELMWFSAIKPLDDRFGGDRSTLLAGGLDIDLICGWEFMRASAVQFYLQAEINLPAYVIENENDFGRIHTWFPTASVKLGISF